ncbi:hypothetical protein [uncultured Acinetobacter sp.]|uniref:hypothetical protein n=1 Tax=uncultured Acinetobacter sp. TaxID=165433 RepID=UPI002584B029|nr:hypothetical protein [uncultured Acinetobacter sp.]
MITYTQEVKEQSRVEIWTKAVKKLTVERDRHRILKPNYIRRLWDYVFDEVMKNQKPNERFIESWSEFSDNLYETKKPQQLKIAYFCGPEPANDLKIMLELGIQVENVWAIESDKGMYSKALLSVQESFPTLKIFKGVISELMKITSFKFDIIYLDFTAPLFSKDSKPLLTINSVFESDSLSDLGVLVINSSLPEKTADNIEFLSSYFRSHPFLEKSIYSGNWNNSYFVEGADCHGFVSKKDLEEYPSDDCDLIFEDLIERNFEKAYSAFSSHYPTIVASYIQPMLRVGSSPALKRMFLKLDEATIKASLDKMTTIPDEELYSNIDFDSDKRLSDDALKLLSGGEVLEDHESFPIWNFISRLGKSDSKLSKYWYQQFTTSKGALSLLDSIQLYDLLRNAQYSYEHTLSEDLANSIKEIISALPDRNGGVFCDVPLPHLWIELALNHLGNAYHANTNAHWRAKYKAKTREMYLDLFVFDNCRALYDWLPMLNLYGKDMATIERQIIVRACMDAITKQNHYSSFFSYYGANLIGIGTKRWSKFGELGMRQDMNV